MRQMEKDRASAANDARSEIEVHNTDQVINAIVPLQLFRASTKRKHDLSII